MKKRLFALGLAFLLLAGLLCGCGGSAKSAEAVQNAAYDMAMPEEALEEAGYDTSGAPMPAPDTADGGAKIIYTADLTLETTAFDAGVEALAALTEECGGYYESSSLNAGGSYRSARYTVRIPAENYRDFITRAGETCHLLNVYEYTEDVSEYYYDAAGRLETQKTKLARLQELLAQAESMEDIIAIESAISETEQQIDALTGELRHYDAQVDYSTVTIYLEEVYRLSNVEEPAQGFSSRLAAALKSGVSGFVSGMETLLIALAYGWVWVLLAAAVAVLIVLLCRRSVKKAKNRTAAAPSPVYTQPEEKKKD